MDTRPWADAPRDGAGGLRYSRACVERRGEEVYLPKSDIHFGQETDYGLDTKVFVILES